jgi:hypothetical protein
MGKLSGIIEGSINDQGLGMGNGLMTSTVTMNKASP